MFVCTTERECLVGSGLFLTFNKVFIGETVMSWIIENKEWLFSGAGVAIVIFGECW